MINIKELNKKDINKNLLIEGDNLDSLDFLQTDFLGKVNIISIDPPYNTGTSLTYNDKFSNGNNHSEWIEFMKIRLIKAKSLLAEDGIILINIDEKEHHRLRYIMDDVFGEENFICDFVWLTGGGKNDSGLIKKKTEYIVTYALNKTKAKFNLKKSDDKNYRYKDEKGKFAQRGFAMHGLKYSKSLDYIITAPNGEELVPGYDRELYNKRKEGEYGVRDWCWTLSQKEFTKRKEDNRIIFKKDKKTNKYKVYYKAYYEGKYIAYDNIIKDIPSNSNNYLKQMFNNERVFDYPKPVELIEYLLTIISKKDSIILDFFAGSGTLGEAVLKLNKKDNGNRKFILCTNNEVEKAKKVKLLSDGVLENSKEWEQEGICKKVTFPRLNNIITGYTNTKGKKINGIGGNLTYIKI